VILFFIIYIVGFITPYLSTILELGFLSNIDALVLSFTFFAFAASLFGLNQPIIYANNRNVKGSEGKEDVETKEQMKYQKSGLSGVEKDEIRQRIIHHLQKEKPYLNPEYNINMLAEELGISRHHATQVINSNLNKNFYTLINELRVEEVISRMNSSRFSNYKILAVAYDAGFNSKSAFNRIFKQTTGKTPTAYKIYSTSY
jgi:AraC-like DNA-binding protein